MKTSPGSRFDQALDYALELHQDQTRKGSSTPYVAHLMSTASLVMQFGGSEDQAVAALLHDAAEDQGGETTLAAIEQRFGGAVASIVGACSDTFAAEKPPWRERKEKYIATIPVKDPAALLVSACDKLDNARAIAIDLRTDGVGSLGRFKGKMDTVWYYRAVTNALAARRDVGGLSVALRELELVVRELEALARPV
jgi:(p)ppGpp synthase/HD superfamily hydrolase